MILADADLGSEEASVAAPRLLLLLLAAALTLLSKALRRHQLASADLTRLPGADPRKVALRSSFGKPPPPAKAGSPIDCT